jgi:hypothetical protein
MRIKYLFLFILLFQCYFSLASPAPLRPDILIISSIEYEIIPYLVMEEYYKEYPRKRPKYRDPRSTAPDRGYNIYELKDKELFVNDVSGQREEIENIKISDFNWINNLYKMIREKRSSLPHKAKADWYSGFLFIAQEGFTFSYKPESSNGYFTVIEIENGYYLRSFVLTNEQYGNYSNAIYDIITQKDEF